MIIGKILNLFSLGRIGIICMCDDLSSLYGVRLGTFEPAAGELIGVLLCTGLPCPLEASGEAKT